MLRASPVSFFFDWGFVDRRCLLICFSFSLWSWCRLPVVSLAGRSKAHVLFINGCDADAPTYSYFSESSSNQLTWISSARRCSLSHGQAKTHAHTLNSLSKRCSSFAVGKKWSNDDDEDATVRGHATAPPSAQEQQKQQYSFLRTIARIWIPRLDSSSADDGHQRSVGRIQLW